MVRIASAAADHLPSPATRTTAAFGKHVVAHAFLGDVMEALEEVDVADLEQAVEVLIATYQRDGAVFVAGNGGSAATASHFVCDLTKTVFGSGQRSLRASSLTDLALLTAYANDTDYSEVFSAQLAAQARPGDCLILISASGNSPNVVKAATYAREHGIATIAFVGSGGALRQIADVSLHVAHSDPGLIEAVHAATTHAITHSLIAQIHEVTAETPAAS